MIKHKVGSVWIVVSCIQSIYEYHSSGFYLDLHGIGHVYIKCPNPLVRLDFLCLLSHLSSVGGSGYSRLEQRYRLHQKSCGNIATCRTCGWKTRSNDRRCTQVTDIPRHRHHPWWKRSTWKSPKEVSQHPIPSQDLRPPRKGWQYKGRRYFLIATFFLCAPEAWC